MHPLKNLSAQALIFLLLIMRLFPELKSFEFEKIVGKEAVNLNLR